MNKKLSILNRNRKPASRTNTTTIDAQYASEQRKFEALRALRAQRVQRQQREIFGTRVERKEMNETQYKDMVLSKMQKQAQMVREMKAEAREVAEMQEYEVRREAVLKEREAARRDYLETLMSQNKSLGALRRRKAEVEALVAAKAEREAPDYFQRFGRNAL